MDNRLKRVQEEPTFLVGTGRCGSTLLASSLRRASPNIECIYETNSLVFFLKARSANKPMTSFWRQIDKQHIDDAGQQSSGHAWRLLPEEAKELFDRFEEDLLGGGAFDRAVRRWADNYHCLQAVRGRAGKIVNKTPALSEHFSALKELWPKSRIVFLVRNPAAVVSSYLRVAWGPSDIRSAIDWYLRRSDCLWKAKDDPRAIVICYEDLLNEPEVQFGALSSFLDEELDATSICRLVDRSRAHTWRLSLSEQQIDKISESLPVEETDYSEFLRSINCLSRS